MTNAPATLSRSVLTMLIASVLLAACLGPSYRWVRYDGNPQVAASDHRECDADARWEAHSMLGYERDRLWHRERFARSPSDRRWAAIRMSQLDLHAQQRYRMQFDRCMEIRGYRLVPIDD
jgi:hypothetical protein